MICFWKAKLYQYFLVCFPSQHKSLYRAWIAECISPGTAFLSLELLMLCILNINVKPSHSFEHPLVINLGQHGERAEHRITDLLESTSGRPRSRIPRSVSSCLLDVSKDKESMAFLSQWLTSIIVKESRTGCSPPDASHQGCTEGESHLPLPACNAPSSTAQEALDFLSHKGSLLVHA